MNLLKRLLAPLVALLAVSTLAEARETPKPALWEVSDHDTTIYVFGTIHLLPKNYRWRTPKFDAAVERSQELVIETIVDEKNPAAIMSAMASLAFSPGLPPLADRVAPEKRAALAAAVQASGLPPAALDRMETWAAAFILLGNQFKQLGLEGAEGVEISLRRAFAAKGKPVAELESNLEQLSYFDRLPEKAQRDLLEGAIEKPREMSKQFKSMLSAWARGDVAGIARTFDRDLASSPDLQQSLIRQRNANWSRWIEERMQKPGSVLLAVGAGHLAGQYSVLSMLEQRGYRVRRLQ
ncbi:MAG TPA: TraB/GumN family protein [Sphingomicrobium sp.]|nr:TraB/GumN family protein [Sphingomicrobium sp.]